MANPLFTQMAQNNPLSTAANMMKNGNPYQVFMQMAQCNPNLQPIVNMINQGANPEQIFRNMCKQQGINADQFIQNLRM